MSYSVAGLRAAAQLGVRTRYEVKTGNGHGPSKYAATRSVLGWWGQGWESSVAGKIKEGFYREFKKRNAQCRGRTRGTCQETPLLVLRARVGVDLCPQLKRLLCPYAHDAPCLLLRPVFVLALFALGAVLGVPISVVCCL